MSAALTVVDAAETHEIHETQTASLAPLAAVGAPALRAVVAPPRADRHPAALYLAQLGAGSRRAMRQALDAAAALVSGGRADAETLDWAALRYQHTAALRAALGDRYAPASANKALSAVRGVLKQCWLLGLMTAEDYHRAANVPRVKGTTLPKGRALSGGEMGGLLGACAADSRLTDLRDAALLAVLYGAGVRRAEAVALDVSDYDPETGALTVRSGKGNKARIAYAEGGAGAALLDWLAVRGAAPGPLFCRIRKGGRNTPQKLTLQRLTPQAVLYVVEKRTKEARVAHCSPHDFRRTFISDLLDVGADIATVQKLAGHASVETTARYDRRGEATKRRAASLLHVPYARRSGGSRAG